MPALCQWVAFLPWASDQAAGTPQACCSEPTTLLSQQHKFKVNKDLIQPQRTKCVVINQHARALGFVFQLLFGKRLVHPIKWACVKWVRHEYHQLHEPWWQAYLNHSSCSTIHLTATSGKRKLFIRTCPKTGMLFLCLCLNGSWVLSGNR